MRRSLGALALVLSACTVGPKVQPAPLPATGSLARSAGTADGQPDTLRSFFDSLAARHRDSTALELKPLTLPADTAGALEWLSLFQDSQLVALVHRAVAENQDVRLAEARIKEFRAQLGIARADIAPQFSVNGSVARQQIVFGSLGTSQFNAFRATADVSWELDFWGRIRRGTEAARWDVGARDADLRATVLTLVSDVARTYLELRELDADRAIAERTLASRRETLRLAQRRFAEGVISELDVRLFEAELAAPTARIAEFTRRIVQKENALRLLLGQEPGEIARGRPLEEIVRSVTLPDSVPSTLIARRPDLLRAQRELNAATARIGVTKAQRLPRFFLAAQYGWQAADMRDIFKSKTGVHTTQAGVSIPLFTGGRLTSQTAAAEARAEQAQIGYERTVLTALREVGDALVGTRTLADEVTAERVQVEALRRGFQLADQRYRNGVASYLEVLDAQRSLFTAELALAASHREYLASAVQLYKVLGGSWVE